jgi:hypothetical protein
MNDRELLELAAKAAGIKIKGYYEDEPSLLIKPGPKLPAARWNPLDDDGDALRLAVEVGLDVWIDKDCCDVFFGRDFGDNLMAMEIFGAGDRHAATRRAIVRAAAKIGKSL